MIPLIFNLGPTELLIILAIVLLLFGGSRLAGLGKSTGRALKEFKEETKGLKSDPNPQPPGLGTSTTDPYPPQTNPTPYQQGTTQPYGDPAAGGNPYQQPPQSGPTNPADRDVRRDV